MGGFAAKVHGAKAGIGGEAVGDDVVLATLCSNAEGAWHFGTDGDAFSGVADDGFEATFNGFVAFKVIDVVEVNIGNDGDGGGFVGEGAIAFVGFCDGNGVGGRGVVNGVGAWTGIGHQFGGVAAETPKGVFANALEEAGHKAAGGGFAMGAADGNGTVFADPTGEAFTAGHDDLAGGSGGKEFGVVGMDCSAIDNGVGGLDVVRRMVVEDGDAVFGKVFAEGGGNVAVAARDLPSTEVEHPSNAGSAYTADAHNVYVAGGEGKEIMGEGGGCGVIHGERLLLGVQ